jgi:cell division protein FtsL
MSAAPAAMLGNSVRGPQSGLPVGEGPTGGTRSEAEMGPASSKRGPQGQRLRTVDAPAYGRSAAQTAPQTSPRTAQSAQSAQSAARPRAFATNGALALANPDFAPVVNPRNQSERETTRPSLRVLRGGKTVSSTRKKVLVTLAVVTLVSIAFAAVFMHASLARTQLSIDKLNIDITQAERMNQRLRVEVATLEAPDRIVSVAQELGLQPPKTVRFLPTATPIALAATRIVR